MKEIIIDNMSYELIKDVRDGFNIEQVKSKLTDYFIPFDYIVGDWAYGKLRLKGFYDEKSKQCKDLNNIKKVDEYLKNNCSYNCKYFILKKSIQK